MSISQITTGDQIVDSYLGVIRRGETGKDIRGALAESVSRCYSIAVVRAGGAQNGVSRDVVNEHISRIRNAYFGDEVRDALKTGLQLCYSARGISPSSSEVMTLNAMINAQTGEDVKNGFLNSIGICCREVGQ